MGHEKSIGMNPGARADPERHELRRSLGFWQVTISGIGIVIGAGIYVLIGPATEEAQNAVWLAFVMAALLSALTGLSYAELAGMFPSAGAEYAFARHAFNEFTGFVVGWMMIAANLIAAAASPSVSPTTFATSSISICGLEQ